MNKSAPPAITVGIVAVILYYLSAPVAADAMGDAIAAGLASGELGGLAAADLIMAVSTGVLFTAFYVAAVATIKTMQGVAVSFLAIPLGWILMLVVAYCGLVGTYPWFAPTAANWYSMPTLFAVYVLNPGAALGIQAALLVASQAYLTHVAGVE